jgi:hypothetical protein
VVHLSTFHATLPRINSLIVDFSTGQIDLRVADRDIELMDNSRSGNSKDRSGTFKNIQLQGSQNQNSGIRSPKFKEKEKAAAPSPTKWHGDRESSEDVQTTVCFGKRESDMGSRDFGGSGDADETGSQSSLSRNAVYQTVEFRWEEEYKARKSNS